MSSPADIDGLRRVLAQAVEMAGLMERGQALTPLRDKVADIDTSLKNGSLTVAALSLDEPSRQALDDLNVRQFLSVTLTDLCSHPVQFSRLLAQANFLIVAGSLARQLTPVEAEVIGELANGMLATLPLVPDAQDSNRKPDWLKHLGTAALPALTLTSAAPPALLADLTPATDLRQALSACHQALRLETTIGLCADRLKDELRRQETRRKTLLRRGADLGGRQAEQAARAATDAIRQDVQVRLNRLETTLTERLRARVLPAAPCMNKLNNLLEDLSANDMVEEIHGRIVQIGVKPDTLRSAVRLLEDMVQEDVQTDLRDATQGVKELEEATQARLFEISSTLGRLRSPVLDYATTWEALRKMTQLDFQHQGEAQRRGILDLISHGRRPVIIVTMMLSMFGAVFGAGTHFRLLVAPLMLLLFLGSLSWAWYEFRLERRERLERELRRLRESLGSQLKRLYELVMREWQGRLTRYLRDADRELIRQVDDGLRIWTQEQTRSAERERSEMQEKQKIVDQRLRELGSMQQQVQRLGLAAGEAKTVLVRAVNAALKREQER